MIESTTPIPDPGRDTATREFEALPPESQAKVLWFEARSLRDLKEHDHALLRRGMIILALLSVALLVVICVMWAYLNWRTSRSREVDQEFHDTSCAVLSLAKGHKVPKRERLFMHEMHRACPQGPGFFDRHAAPAGPSRPNAAGRVPRAVQVALRPSQAVSGRRGHPVATGPGYTKGPGTRHQPNSRPSAAPTPAPGRPRPTPTQVPHSPAASPSPSGSTVPASSSSPSVPPLLLPSLPLASPLLSVVSSLLP